MINYNFMTKYWDTVNTFRQKVMWCWWTANPHGNVWWIGRCLGLSSFPSSSSIYTDLISWISDLTSRVRSILLDKETWGKTRRQGLKLLIPHIMKDRDWKEVQNKFSGTQNKREHHGTVVTSVSIILVAVDISHIIVIYWKVWCYCGLDILCLTISNQYAVSK